MKHFSITKLEKDLLELFSTMTYSVEKNFQQTEKIVLDLTTNNLVFVNYNKRREEIIPYEGICGDLSLITYNYLEKNYPDLDIDIVVGHDSKFFTETKKWNLTHTYLVLKISKEEEYVIDPSFKIFRHMEQSNYVIDKVIGVNGIKIKANINMELRPFHTATNPIKIVNDHLILLCVNFKDKNNFSMHLLKKYKHDDETINLFSILKINGQDEERDNISGINKRDENNPVIEQDVEIIKNTMKRLWKTIEIKENN